MTKQVATSGNTVWRELKGLTGEIARAVFDYLLLALTGFLLLVPLSTAIAMWFLLEGPLAVRIGLVVTLGGASVWLVVVCLLTAWRVSKHVTCPFCGGRTRRRTATTEISGMICSHCGLLIADLGISRQTVDSEEAHRIAEDHLKKKKSSKRRMKEGAKQIAVGIAILLTGNLFHKVLRDITDIRTIVLLIALAPIIEGLVRMAIAAVHTARYRLRRIRTSCPACGEILSVSPHSILAGNIICKSCDRSEGRVTPS